MTRGQVDLIDFQSIPDGDFKWIMNYQDHATKYLCLRPLRSKRAREVADELLKIFLQLGAPSVLQSDNGREFANVIVEELKIMWPDLTIVHGRPRHPQSQGSVERANQDIENMLRAWMLENKSTAWSTGCYFVQWQKNNSLHRVIGRSPYKAVFGIEPKQGLKSTNLPQNIINSITTEEELEKLETEISSSIQKNRNGEIEEHRETEIEIEPTVIEIDQERSSDSVENEEESGDRNILILNNREKESVNIDDLVVHPSNEYQKLSLTTESCASETPVETVALEMGDNLHSIVNPIVCCIICQKNISESVEKCESCNMPFHPSCANGRTQCNLCFSEISIKSQQDKCFEGQKRQAEQMILVTKKRLPNVEIGDCVLVNVEKVDRSPGDPPNLISVVTDIKNGVYQVGTSSGIIKSWFSRPDLKKASSNFLNLELVNRAKFLSLREAVSLASLFKGQGYVKCLCQPSKIQCNNNRCKCFKAKVQCNSRCHRSGPCINK